jgi:hypothetical protein
MTEISREDFLKLQGLLTVARYHSRMLDDLERAAREITGEEPNGGHTSDAIFNDFTAELLLAKLEIKVARQ